MKRCHFQIGAQLSHGVVEDDTNLLAPVIPTVLYAAGPNYRGHLEGMANRRGEPPRYPGRSPSSARRARSSARGQHRGAEGVHGGGSAGWAARRGDRAEGQREWHRTLFRAKNCDTFKPFGPWIVTGLDPRQLRIVVRHNGTVWEDFSSADQTWDTATWIHKLSKTTTLHPGDVLWMGTEGADGDMVPGDVIEVEISGIGTLRNPIVAET
jgi:2-keto-4-pentenoate hydratase/2-oxohepta-3-ene-1,7-dioic acid hydratase in catechol pathway